MKKIQKNFIKLLAGTAITGILCLAGAKTNEKAEAIKRYDVVVSMTDIESENSKTTDTGISKFVIDDQRDISYFDAEALANGRAYKDPDKLWNDPLELIIPKTYNNTTITHLGTTMELHAGTDINTPNWTYTYGPFYNCSRLERVFIPDTIKTSNSIFEDLGYGIRNNMDIYLYSDDIQNFFEKSYGSIIFQNDYSYYDMSYNALINGEVLEDLTVPENITEINEGAFFQCKSLKKVTVPKQVTQIGSRAFLSPDLESIAIYDPNCVINDNAIANSKWYDKNTKKYVYSFDGVIYGYTDSTAQKYAEKHGYKFEALDKEPITTVPETTTTDITMTDATTTTTVTGTQPSIPGDADGDGKLNVRDAAHIARKLAQRKAHELPTEADFNGDGKIDVRDAANIAKKLAEAKVAPQKEAVITSAKETDTIVTTETCYTTVTVSKEAITTSVKETDTSVTINPSYTTVTVPIELITSDVSKSTETVPTQGETADIKWVVNDDKQLIISKNNTGNTCSTGDWCETYIEYGTVYTLDGGSFEIPIEKDRILETPWSKCDYNSVIIEEGVTEIGDCTFRTAKFDKISLPDSLKVIKVAAFRGAVSSAKFIFPPNLTDIGAAAFMYSSFDFGDVVFSSSLSNLGKFAFSNCSGINSADLSRSSVKDIKDYTFENCRNLQSVNFPLQLESIGDDAFANTNIKEYVILSRNVMFDYHPMGYYSEIGEPVATETKFIGYAGSTVEEYANSSDKFSFEPLDEE